jgi:hypothetical protein
LDEFQGPLDFLGHGLSSLCKVPDKHQAASGMDGWMNSQAALTISQRGYWPPVSMKSANLGDEVGISSS